MIFRVHSVQERPHDTIQERTTLFGWTYNKKLAKSFLKQRNPDKYRMIHVDRDDAEKYYSDIDYDDLKLDFVKLPSISKKWVYIISTQTEIRMFKGQLQEYLEDLVAIESILGDGNYPDMIYNLQPHYVDALDYIGYHPREFDYLFANCIELSDTDGRYPASNEQVINECIYTAEAFIRIMKYDMI